MTNHISEGYQLITFGDEKEPVIVIDNFSSQFAALKLLTEQADYSPVAGGYPGIRAPASPAYLRERQDMFAQILRQHYGYSFGADIQGMDYSIVTTQPAALSQAQRMPHYDDVTPDLLALLHYVNCPDDGGTAFYRHKATGYETISDERQDHYAKVLKEEMAQYGDFPEAYIDGDNARFEKIGEVQAKPNRMVIYRGRTLHSGCIRQGANFSADPKLGRVTVNIFMTDAR